MSRDIKYKLWYKGNMILPDGNGYFYLADYDEEVLIDGFGRLCVINDLMECPIDEDWELIEYTGLKDANGTEIYEGDILGLDKYMVDSMSETFDYESIHRVVWGGEDYPAFDLKPNLYCEENALSHLSCSPESPDYEVIGNKFENPELLEAEYE